MTIRRSVVVAQGKGGVGKTSLSSNVAGLAAAGGLRTLVVDLDPQGNVARDFGLEPDDGRDLLTALVTSGPLPVRPGVRDGLDVVLSGQEVADVSLLAQSRQARGGVRLAETLHSALAAIEDDYDLIVIDSPPGERVLVEAALGVAQAVVVPTRADAGSLDGLEVVAKRLAAAWEHNPDVRLAGVVLFGIGARTGAVEAEVRATIRSILGESAPIFDARIRHAEVAAYDARNAGLLVHELEGAAAEGRRARLAALRTGDAVHSNVRVRNASGLADDYEALTREILTRLAAIEQEVSADAR
ncbi:ParA family protein [Cellulomonas cellasea]|uniref:ParA family protein n=1 Tax=Cellulomonas cellasea TaxID=43670 RepID=UPI0016172DAA|nr:ParA family protein [Cellulomonas cellasea]